MKTPLGWAADRWSLGARALRWGTTAALVASVLIVLGGDGFLLHMLHQLLDQRRSLPVFGMNRGTIGFLIPDRFHLVYLEFARAAHALGLHSTTGSRISISRTAA